jgi:hypothetical protein
MAARPQGEARRGVIGGRDQRTIRVKAHHWTIGLAGLAIMAGLAIAWVDSRPGWDDTGLTAAAVFLAAAFFAAVAPRKPWLWALAVGAWVPLFGIVGSRNAGSLLAPVIAFVGATAGALARRALAPPRSE